MTNVVELKLASVGSGRQIEPNRVLAGGRAANLRQVVVFGFDQDGDLYVASSEGPGDTMWLIEAAKLFLLNGCER